MNWPFGTRIRVRPSKPDAPGVYVTLDELVRLEFKARGVTFLPRQPVHSLLTGRHGSRMRGRGLNFEEIRGYLPGDDIRTIDWKVTARVREPHVRVFTEERDRPAWLVVDQRLAMFFGSKSAMKSVTAAHAAALGAWRVFAGGDRVGAVVFNDTARVEIRPHRSRRQVLRILNAILEQNRALGASSAAEPNPGQLNAALDAVVRRGRHGCLVVVISDFDGADDRTRVLMNRLAERNDVIAVLVHDPMARELPAGGRLLVSDGELQVTLDTADGAVRERLLAQSTGRIRKILDWQRTMGVPVLPISTAEDVADQVRVLLGRAAQARRG
jgi:uncharacterized protein (DUF58 family)